VTDQLREFLGHRRLNLVAGLVAGSLLLLAGAMAPGLASAEVPEGETPEGPELPLEELESGIRCGGKVLKSKDPEFPLEYSFKCDREVRSYTLVSNREIDGTETEPFGRFPDGELDLGVPADNTTTPPTPAVPNGHFICIASLPGWGLACAGRRGQSTLKVGSTMQAGFSVFNPICDANSQPKFWVVPVYEYTEENNLATPPSIRKFLIAAEPIALNSRAVRCKVLNPKAKAKKECARAKRAKGTAKKKANARCKKAKQAVKASR
jgi:hypothetical protein